MSEIEVTDEIIEEIDEARAKTLYHAREQVRTSIDLFSSGKHPEACFLAMTAIEEAGKVGILQFVRGNHLWGTPSRIDTTELESILSGHKSKALRSAASALCVNNRARRIHGTYPGTDFELKHGVLLLARVGKQWGRIRENCLYTDLDLNSKSLASPPQEIDSNYSYYFICMAGEVVAEEAERGLGSRIEGRNPEESLQFLNQTRDEIDAFVEEYEAGFDPTEIGFFTDPRFKERREEISQSLDLSEEQIEWSIQNSMNDFRMSAEAHGMSEDEIEKKASERRDSLEDSYPECIPSKECVRELQRLAEDINNVVIGGWD